MAKDPAFLFYTGDFSTGTQFFSDDQVGKYVRLLMAQHQHGHLTEKQMRIICGGIADVEIYAKFIVDSDNKYYNQRLEDELIKRKKHSEKQKENANMRWHKNGKDLAMPLENKNENKDIVINTKIKVRENVFLKSKEIESLEMKYSPDQVNFMYDKLSAYKLSSGKNYKSDYGAIISWVVDEYKKQNTTKPSKGQQIIDSINSLMDKTNGTNENR